MADQDDDLELLDVEEEKDKPRSIGGALPLPAKEAAQAIPLQPSITGATAMPPPVPKSVTAGPLGGNQSILPPTNIPQAPLAQGITSQPLAPRPAYDALQKMEQEGPAINRKHGIGGGILKTLETAGTILSPGAMEAIPGTRMNFALRTQQAKNAADEEAKQLQDAAVERETNERSELTGEQVRNLQSEEQSREAQGELVPVTDAQGNTFNIPRKDLAGYEKAQQANATREGIAEKSNRTKTDIAAGKNETSKDIAGEKITSTEGIASANRQSRESIAAQANETRKLIAAEHQAAAKDPNALTAQMKTMKQQAQATLPEIDAAIDETRRVAGQLGPTSGRWNDFWQGKIGASDPTFAHYKDEIAFVSTAVALAHARGRMSNELFEHFQRMFDAGKQSPDNMQEALKVAKEWLTGYANMGEGGTAPPSEQHEKGTIRTNKKTGAQDEWNGTAWQPLKPKS